MAFLKNITILCLISVNLSSCGMYIENLFRNTDSADSRSGSIQDISMDLGSEYNILLVSDVHFDANYTRPSTMLSKISDMDIAMCVVLGDLTRNCTESEFDSYLQWGSKVSFYFLDSGEGSHGDAQIDNLREIIKSDTNRKVIFSHYPLYAPDSLTDKLNKATERALLISLFSKNNVSYYFCGHTHEHYTHNFGDFTEIILGSLRWGEEWAILHINENTSSITYKYF